MSAASRALSALLLVALVTACQSLTGSVRPSAEDDESTAAETQDRGEEVAALHEQINASVETYREAVALLDEGSVETGSNLMEDAMRALDDAVSRCESRPGCDLALALDAYRRVLDMQEALFEEDHDVAPHAADEPVEEAAVISSGRSLNGVDLAEQITLNRHVLDALHDWLTWKRPHLITSFQNFRLMRQEMLPPYIEAGLPEALLFGILAVESGGKVHSFSRAGAAGPLQFMRATARRYGLRDVNGFDERFSPARAAAASVAYLNDQFRQLDFSLEKTLAAYNAGENRLKRLNARLRGASFWSSDFFYSLPSDTRRYVPDVLAAAWLFLHPDDYHLTLPVVDDAMAELTVDAPVSLSELSICLGNSGADTGWFRALRNLNPELDPGDRVKAGHVLRVPEALVPEFDMHCSKPELRQLAATLREASESRESDLLPYVIRSGDTLSRIASRYRCMSLKELAAVNNIAAPRYFIRAGKTIKVPNC